MTTVETGYAHIVLDEKQVPIIDDTNMKVIELVAEHLAYGWSPEELAHNFPHLTLGQVHSALAYYWDHQAEIDAEIARDLAWIDELRRNTPEPPFVARLRARGLLPQYSMK